MKKKYNFLQILIKVYKCTLKTVPLSGIFSIFNYIIQGLLPAFTTVILAKLFDSAYSFDKSKVVLYGIIFILAYVLIYIIQFISSITINAGVYEKCKNYYKMKIYKKCSDLSLILYEDSEMLNLQNRAKDCVNREILSQIYMSTAIFITSGISVISVVIVLASYNLWFIIISIISVIPYFISRLIRGKEFYYVKYHQAKKTRLLEYLWGLFNKKETVKEMRIMKFDKYITDKWINCRDEVNEENWKQNKKNSISLLICDTMRIIGYGVSITFAILLVINGDISVGLFGACINSFRLVQGSVKEFLIELGNLPEKVAYANDYFRFLDMPKEKNGINKVKTFNAKITIHNLSFKYPNSSNFALKNVNLEINKGEKIVIVGENGCGKTTLCKLMLGVYPLHSGNILYDNISIKNIDKSTLCNFITVIAQNYINYKLSLRENIAISDVSKIKYDKEIIDVLKENGAGDIISKINGLDIQLGKEFGGIELSGGQWQKLAISRGMFKRSKLIVLDEPTASLDPLIENEILMKIVNVIRNKTAIIISHRVGLCKFADKIIVMKNGTVVEVGTHSELLAKRNEYYKLYSAQEKWYK